jgi:pectate lyase
MKKLAFFAMLVSACNISLACEIDTSLYSSGINYAEAPCATSLLNERSGFARPSGGAKTGVVYNVSSLADSGPGSLRDGLDTSAWIVFSVSGEIKLQSPLRIQNQGDFTIDGRGQEISISGYGLYILDAENVIVNDIEIKNGLPDATDAIMVARSNQVWVHKTSLSNFPDGLLDITRAPAQKSRVTVSWSRFSNHDKVMIVGLTRSFIPTDRFIYATIHHNYFAGVLQRIPRLSQGYAHVYNNVMFWKDHGMASYDNGRLLAEHNLLSSVYDSLAVEIDHPDQISGRVRLVNNTIFGDAIITPLENEPQSVGYPWYSYDLEPVSTCLWNNVVHAAGSNREVLEICVDEITP